METLGSRIKSLRKQKKLTQKELGRRLDISDVSVLKWENDTNTPKLENIHQLAIELDTTVEFIMYGKDPSSSNVQEFRPVARMLPVLTHIQCGTMSSVRSISPHDIEQWLPAPPEAGKNSFYLITQGISNSPYFNDGEYVCIDPDVDFSSIQTGEMIVVCQDDDATFKALVKEYNKYYLKALNENFQPNIIPLKENSEYRGKYVGKFTPSKKFL